MNLRSLSGALVVVAAMLPAMAPAAHNCSCSVTSCSTDCNETDLRNAVNVLNGCGGTTQRTLTFNAGYGCVINMAQTSATASCTGDAAGEKAVCLKGTNMVIDGANAVQFSYSGTGKCASDQVDGEVDPTLFTLQGNANTVKNFSMQYFPEGLYIATGSNHRIEGVTNHAICEDAVTVQNGAGSGHVIAGNNFKGNTPPASGRQCYKADNGTILNTSNCGIDKALQINGGTVRIEGNIIDTIGQPVNIVRGTGHLVIDNVTLGSPTDDNVCQAYTVDKGPVAASAAATFTNNSISYCKFGIRAVGNSSAEVIGNTICNSYVSAFQVKADGTELTALMKGSGNKLKTAGTSSTSEPKGGLVNKDSSGARVDFGGGDASGAAVIGGSTSPGGNVFCQGTRIDVNNAGGGSIGARSNCFDSLPPQQNGAVAFGSPSVCTTCDTFCP